MQITLFSFLSAVLWSSVLIIAIYFLRKTHYKHYFGMLTIVLLYLFCAARVFLPLEFPHAYIINDQTVYPHIYQALTNDDGLVKGISLLHILCVIWIGVLGVLLIRYICNYYKASKSIEQYAEVCDEHVQHLVNEVKSLVKKDIDVTVFMVSNIDTPFGFGLFRKRILLPRRNYDEEELRYILLHEYTHFTNRDILVKLLVSLFCMIFWWDPVAHLLKRDLEQTLEIKCDLSVAKRLNAQERAGYLRTIISTLKHSNLQNTPPSAATAFFNGNGNAAVEVKERFKAVMDCNKGKFYQAANTLIMCVFVVFLCLSYSIIPQPMFDAPESTESGAIDFDTSSSYLRQDKDGNYWLCIGGMEPLSVPESDASFYLETGISIIKE